MHASHLDLLLSPSILLPKVPPFVAAQWKAAIASGGDIAPLLGSLAFPPGEVSEADGGPPPPTAAASLHLSDAPLGLSATGGRAAEGPRLLDLRSPPDAGVPLRIFSAGGGGGGGGAAPADGAAAEGRVVARVDAAPRRVGGGGGVGSAAATRLLPSAVGGGGGGGGVDAEYAALARARTAAAAAAPRRAAVLLGAGAPGAGPAAPGAAVAATPIGPGGGLPVLGRGAAAAAAAAARAAERDRRAQRTAAAEGRRVRGDRASVEAALFQCFERQAHWSFAALHRAVGQPAPWVKEVLRDIAVYNQRGPHKETWEVKREYRTTG